MNNINCLCFKLIFKRARAVSLGRRERSLRDEMDPSLVRYFASETTALGEQKRIVANNCHDPKSRDEQLRPLEHGGSIPSFKVLPLHR